MNAYFFKMNQAERNDILDQHKKVYDGYVTTYGQQVNQQPLYIQDLANDKLGLTVNNKGEIKHYTNVRINEMRYDGKDTGLFSEEEDFYMTPSEEDSEFMEEDDFQNEIEEDEIVYEIEKDYDFDVSEIEDEIYEDMEKPLEEQVNKVLDMFKRFKKYGNN